MLGEYDAKPVWATDRERRAAWFQHREYFMNSYFAKKGRRPQAFWWYEQRNVPKGIRSEAEAIWKLKLGPPEEIEFIERTWRDAITRALLLYGPEKGMIHAHVEDDVPEKFLIAELKARGLW